MAKMPEHGSITMAIRAYEDKKKEVEKLGKDAEQATQRTINDFKTRGPGWVASAVTEVYNIKKKEVLGAKTGAKSIGSIKMAGNSLDNVSLEFVGRPLTPTHFGMKPKNRPKSKRDESGKLIKRARQYKVTAEVIKGQEKSLGPQVFLGSNKGSGQTTEIPFQRKEGAGRYPIKSVKTVSIPQMITNEQVAEKIQESINEGLGKRLEHHLKRVEQNHSPD